MENSSQTRTWPELAIGLYDQLTKRNAEITYDFQDFSVAVPSGTGEASKANWTMNGQLSIRTRDHQG
jgi:hypothetical protein